MITTQDILDKYAEVGNATGTARELGISFSKCVKALSSKGICVSDRHKVIYTAYMTGVKPESIAHALGVSTKIINKYIPRTRPEYKKEV